MALRTTILILRSTSDRYLSDTEFTKDFIKRFPSTALDQRFTSEVCYEESVDLLREKELEKWMDAHGGRIAKAYSASCKEFENRSASAHPTDVVESTETTDRTRSESDPRMTAIKDPKATAPKIKGTQLIRVVQKKEPKWDVRANEHLPNDAFFAGGGEFSYKSPTWEGDIGHGRWDEDDAKDTGSMGNWWTMPIQYCFLSHRQVAHKASSDEGTVHTFLGAIPNLFMHRWPPVHEGMIIDMTGRARTVDPQLLEVTSSPEDAPFPRMDRGFLDLGPDLCLDRCELVDITLETRLELGLVLEAQRTQVKQWFPNNLKDRKVKAILGVKLKANLKCPPSIQHVYSHLLYDVRGIHAKVTTEAERLGVSPNNINVINRVTGEEWEKEPEEVKQTIVKLHKEQKELSKAMKEHRIDDIELTAEQKSAVINSLGIEFNQVFKLIHGATDWGFLVLGAGIDPESGKLQSSSWEYGTMLKSGENFFNRFNKDAVAGLVPEGFPGDKRMLSHTSVALYWLICETWNVELLPKDHESTSDSEAMEVDPLPHDVPEANDDVVMSSNDAPHLLPTPDHDPLPDSALKVVRYPSPTPDHDLLPDFVPSTTVFLPLPTPNPILPPTKFGPIPDDDPLPDFVPDTTVFLPLPTPNLILPPINLGPISFSNSSITEAFPGQPAPEIAPEWNDFPMMFMPSEGTPAYNNDDVFLPSPQGSSFSSLDTDGSSLSLNAQAQSSGDGLDITNGWSESFMLQCYEQLLASFPTPNPSYLADGPPPLDLNMHPTESASLFTSPAAPPLHPSSGPAVPPSNKIVSANATATAVRQKPTSDELSVKASRRGPLNKPAQQMPIPDIPRQAQNRKASGSREVTTLVSIEPSPPPGRFRVSPQCGIPHSAKIGIPYWRSGMPWRLY
ncbi:uncharacterized protein ARMOST_16133 [Armillaria ostoyae]|uniref:Uncharacterized protein n=1 Tax=Armillaria ostoyae TaxID=47428 RepID=A0A284RVC5_ARMOS|nr:uncharacterized protein ARMOST_16133 [Armillaria ostoyae]